MNLDIADTIFDEYPDLVLGVVIAHDIDNSKEIAEVVEQLRIAEAMLPGKFGDIPVIQHPYIVPWREAYRKFGARPKNYPSSVENLARRVLQGTTITHINNLVSMYNTISLRYILPVGGEDLDKIVGDVLLSQASDDEPAVTLLGEQEARTPHAGEIIYKDEVGAICRRWNWKESDRTKLTKDTQNVFLVIESLPPVDRNTVEIAIGELAGMVEKYCGGVVSTAFLDKDKRLARLK
jgi:DNA/RNA-binding domain of Phe-tRNA-synthetase-like protein